MRDKPEYWFLVIVEAVVSGLIELLGKKVDGKNENKVVLFKQFSPLGGGKLQTRVF